MIEGMNFIHAVDVKSSNTLLCEVVYKDLGYFTFIPPIGMVIVSKCGGYEYDVKSYMYYMKGNYILLYGADRISDATYHNELLHYIEENYIEDGYTFDDPGEQ